MKYKKWVGDSLQDLALPWEQFSKKHPDIKKTNYRALRRYHKIKGELRMPETSPEKEPIKRLVSESEYDAWIKNSDGEIESEPKVARRYEYVYEEPQPEDTWPQIEGSNIRPTRRKKLEKYAGRIMTMAYGDGQTGFRRIIRSRLHEDEQEDMELVPMHNVEAHRIYLQMNAHYMPEYTVNGGDFSDFPEFSRFPADSNHFHETVTPTLWWIHDFYAQMVADNPNATYGGSAQHIELDSNHAKRPKKKSLQENPELYNYKRPGETYPAHTYFSMANLERLGIDFKSGYPAILYMHLEETGNPIGMHHGSTSSSSPGATVRKERDKNPDINIMRFHGHGEEKVMRTTRDGKQLFYWQLGSSCYNEGPVPGFGSAVDDHNEVVDYYNPNHQNTFAIIMTAPDGRHSVTTIEVIDGKAWYDGVLWDGSEPYEWEHKYGYIKEET